MSNVFAQFGSGLTAWDAPLDARLAFIRRTYVHLTAAIGLLVAASWALFASGVSESMLFWVAASPMRWLLVLGGFTVGGWLATSMAHSAKSQGAQYAGLTLYSLMQAVIFAPILYLAVVQFPGKHILETAAGISLLTFGGLSGIVLTTKKDFSFLGIGLKVGFFVALGLIVVSLFAGFSLGIWFTGAMILFAAGAVLYSTSRVLHQYRTDQHVGAALELFGAIAMLFYYVVMLLMQLQRRD